MSSIFFVEFVEDIQCFLKHREPGDIIIALRPEISLELDILKISHRCLRIDYYTHEEHMEDIAESTRHLKSLLFALDEELWRYDPEYRSSRIRPFEMFIYFFNFSFPVLRSQIFELDKLFNKEHVDKVKLFKHNIPSIYSDLSFHDDGSLYGELVYLMRDKYKYSVEAIDNKCGLKTNTAQALNPRHGFYTWREIHFIRQIKRLIKKLYRLKNNCLNRKGNMLSVDCDELSCIEQRLAGLGWSIYQFPESIIDIDPIPSKYNGLITRFEKNKYLMKSFEFLGINFFGMMKSRLEYFCQNLETNLRRYKILSDYIDLNHFDIVFFNTHTPFKVQDVMLSVICRERKIPYVCWMHGGYGANYAASGYELSDYTFGQHYFVYGEEVKKLIDLYYPQYKLSTHVAGSPKILRWYQDYVPPKNSKKVITLVGAVWSTNTLHQGVDSPYVRFSYWVPSKAILELLIQYRHKYRVIIRARLDQDRLQIETFRKFLKYHNAEEIEIITVNEASFKEIVEVTDLFITLWVSTTFWEACLSHADIFLMDNSDLTETAKEIVAKRAFWYDDLTGFIQGLRQYLDRGVFYQKSHDKTFLKRYMDFDRKDSIAEHVSQTAEGIILKGEVWKAIVNN